MPVMPGSFRKALSLFFVFLFLQVLFVSAQTSDTQVTGRVTTASGEPLAGATVNEKGAQTATYTRPDGSFSIKVSHKDATLVISFIGYERQEIKLANNQQVVEVSLKPSENSMNEVVVIGYGTVRRKDLTGAVSSVSGKQLSSVPVANAAQALTGKIPGVNVTSQDGRPDASISIRVRGGGSISQSTEPLYIVDGFPVGSISDIPSNQIESIDVLKDASSTAIYGARGANGVVIVTTRSGRSGKLTINYDAYAQWNQPTRYLETMNAYDYIAYNWAYASALTDSYANAWEMLWGIGRYANTYNNPEGIDHYRNVAARNYSKDAYGSSFSHTHNLSVSSGNAKTKYLLAGSYTDNDGMRINSWFKRANALFKLNQQVASNVDFSFDTRFTNIQRMSNESTTNGRGSILSSAYQFRPIATQDVLGELDDSKNTQLGLYDIVLQDQFNPVERMKDYLPLSTERSVRSNAALSWKIIKGLTAHTELGFSFYWNRAKTWGGAIYNNYFDKQGNKTYSGSAAIASSEGWNLRWVNTLNYQVKLHNDHHQLNMTVGQEVNNSGAQATNQWASYYPVSFTADRAFAMMEQYFDTVGNAHGFSSSEGTPSRLYSYFGRLNYSLFDKYLLTLTFRADGSSRFSPAHKWGYFPAAAVAWRMSDEDFLKDVRWLSSLKMRLSYGEVGNDGINANLWRMQWSSDGLVKYSINEKQQQSYSPQTTAPNENLKWETTITRDLGFDFAFLGNRIYGTIDLYKNSSKDLLLLTPVPPFTGFSYTYDNIGSISNRGIELSLGGDIVRSKDFTLSASFNITFNRSRVDELGTGVNGLYKTQWGSTVTQPNTGDYVLQVGKPVGQVRGYTYEGWYTPDDFDYNSSGAGTYTLKKGTADLASGILGTVQGTKDHKPNGQSAYPGVVKFKDVNGDHVIDENDVTVIGDMTPKHTGGFNINSKYKDFDLSLNFNWSYGNKVYNANYLAAFYGSKEDGLYRNRLNYLSSSYKIYDIQNGSLVSVVEPGALNALNANATTFLPYQENPVVSSMGIQDGSFLRLNTVTLGYDLPKSLVAKAKMTRLRVYGTIYNALTLTSYPGLDPEVNTNISQGSAQYPTLGLDWGAYPRARSFTLGLNVEF